jgi:hypothetical protein
LGDETNYDDITEVFPEGYNPRDVGTTFNPKNNGAYTNSSDSSQYNEQETKNYTI